MQEKKTSQTLTSRNSRTPRHSRCRGYLESFGGSRPWRSTPADSARTRLKKLGKANKILTIHSLVTPDQGKMEKGMVKKLKGKCGGEGEDGMVEAAKERWETAENMMRERKRVVTSAGGGRVAVKGLAPA